MWRRSVADGGVVLFRVRLLKRLVQLPRRKALNVVNVDGYHNSPSDARAVRDDGASFRSGHDERFNDRVARGSPTVRGHRQSSERTPTVLSLNTSCVWRTSS